MPWIKHLLFKLWLILQSQIYMPEDIEVKHFVLHEVDSDDEAPTPTYRTCPPPPPPSPIDMMGIEGEDEWEDIGD